MPKGTLRGKVGSPAIGPEEFFNRERELARLMEKVERGESIYISAPRRIGKTSLMRRMEKELENAGHTCLFFDLEAYESPAEWIAAWFIDAVLGRDATLTKKIGTVVKNVCARWAVSFDTTAEGVLRGLFDASNWRERGDGLFEALVKSLRESPAPTKRLIVFLDELAVMIEHFGNQREDADRFLAWLRSVQQRYHDRLSFVAASSVGLAPLLNKLALSNRMNAFSIERLEAWTPETAVRCIHALARGAEMDLDEGVAECMVRHLGWCSPSFVQLFFDVLRDEYRGRNCTCEDVEKIYREKIVRGYRGDYQLNHLEERLRNTFNEDDYAQARGVLAFLSNLQGPGSTGAEAVAEKELVAYAQSEGYYTASFGNILQNLEYDGYILKDNRGWFFRPGLLKDWWRHRYGDSQ